MLSIITIHLNIVIYLVLYVTTISSIDSYHNHCHCFITISYHHFYTHLICILGKLLSKYEGQLPTRLWIAPPTRMDETQLVAGKHHHHHHDDNRHSDDNGGYDGDDVCKNR